MPNWCGPAWSGPGRRAGVSRPKVIEREGFLKHFAAVVERLGDGSLSRRKAAKELDIGYATLKHLIDARLAVVRQSGMSPRSPTRMDEVGEIQSFAPVVEEPCCSSDRNRSEAVRAARAQTASLTKSLNSKP